MRSRKIDATTEEGREQIEGGIEWEGFSYYFLDYYPDGVFEPLDLRVAVREFQRARAKLESTLNAYGVTM